MHLFLENEGTVYKKPLDRRKDSFEKGHLLFPHVFLLTVRFAVTSGLTTF